MCEYGNCGSCGSCGSCLNPFTIPNGADGAPGIQGIQGFTGPAGADGVDGADGIQWLSGTVDPTTEGLDGYFYLNSATGDIYGPKTAGVWGASIMNIGGITGQAGQAGQAGLSFHSGVGVPIPSLGVDNDSYVDLASIRLDLYKKSAGVWVDTGIDLKGSDGSGADGFNFIQGAAIPASGLGNDGDSYINSDTGDLYIKQMGTWTITGNLSSASLSSLYAFRAIKTADQSIQITNTQDAHSSSLLFENYSTGGYYDYGNDWYTNRYVVPRDSLPQKFIVENIVIERTDSVGQPGEWIIALYQWSPNTQTWSIMTGGNNGDNFWGDSAQGDTKTIISMHTGYSTPIAGTIIELRMVKASGINTSHVVHELKAGAILSNSFA